MVRRPCARWSTRQATSAAIGGHALIFATMTYDAGALFGWGSRRAALCRRARVCPPFQPRRARDEAVWGRFEKGHFDFSRMSREAPHRRGEDKLPALRKGFGARASRRPRPSWAGPLKRGCRPTCCATGSRLRGPTRCCARLRDERRPRAHLCPRGPAGDRDPKGRVHHGSIAVAAAFIGSQLEVYDRARGRAGRGGRRPRCRRPRIWTHAARGLGGRHRRGRSGCRAGGPHAGPSVRAGSGWRGRFGRPHPFDGHQPEAHGGRRSRKTRSSGGTTSPHSSWRSPRTWRPPNAARTCATASPASSRSARGRIGFSIPRSVEATHLISPGRRKVRDRTTPAGRSESFLLGFFPETELHQPGPHHPPHPSLSAWFGRPGGVALYYARRALTRRAAAPQPSITFLPRFPPFHGRGWPLMAAAPATRGGRRPPPRGNCAGDRAFAGASLIFPKKAELAKVGEVKVEVALGPGTPTSTMWTGRWSSRKTTWRRATR